jgi:exonuclease III
VAILVDKKLDFKPLRQYIGQNENALVIVFEKNGGEICLGSVYGPNNTDRDFYNFLTRVLEQINGTPVILGGNWNTTWDNSPPESNLGVHNMARTPNAANGKLLKHMSNLLSLTDPFRALNPNLQAFSYSPFGTQRKNRSRLDFFLISTSLVVNIMKCGIFSVQLSTMFDHKPVFMSFKDISTQQFLPKKNVITNWFLGEPLVKMTAELAAFQVFSQTQLTIRFMR